eukprot:IDg11561t1
MPSFSFDDAAALGNLTNGFSESSAYRPHCTEVPACWKELPSQCRSHPISMSLVNLLPEME